MKKWVLPLAALLLLLLIGYVAGGPFIAMWAIRNALAENDTAKLQKYVDLEAVRANLRAQVEDHLARKAGAKANGKLGLFALSVANTVAGTGIDAAVTPAGIGAILGGRSIWKQAMRETVDGDTFGKPLPPDPLKGAKYEYASASEFDATIRDENGKPMTFVFARDGLGWKLTNIKLDLD